MDDKPLDYEQNGKNLNSFFLFPPHPMGSADTGQVAMSVSATLTKVYFFQHFP